MRAIYRWQGEIFGFNDNLNAFVRKGLQHLLDLVCVQLLLHERVVDLIVSQEPALLTMIEQPLELDILFHLFHSHDAQSPCLTACSNWPGASEPFCSRSSRIYSSTVSRSSGSHADLLCNICAHSCFTSSLWCCRRVAAQPSISSLGTGSFSICALISCTSCLPATANSSSPRRFKISTRFASSACSSKRFCSTNSRNL